MGESQCCGSESVCTKDGTVAKKKVVSRRLGANQIPEDILHNKLLNDTIAKLLPSNYNFEIHKTIFKALALKYFTEFFEEKR